MPRTTTARDKWHANAQRRDIAKYEQLGIRAAGQLGLRMMSRALHAARRGEKGAITEVAALIEGAAPFLRDAMVISYLLGEQRAKHAASISLSATDRAMEALARRMDVSPRRLTEIERQMGVQALRVLDGVKASTERRLQQTIMESTRSGAHIEQGVQDLREAFQASGITPTNSFQLEAIFRTQTQLAYGAGKWNAAQDPVIQEILWGYKYVTVGDDRVRPSHQLLEGVTLPKDDTFWTTSFPPNGWACRCQAIEIFEERDLVAPPKEVEIDGKVIKPGPDKGFAFNPGTLINYAAGDMGGAKTYFLPPPPQMVPPENAPEHIKDLYRLRYKHYIDSRKSGISEEGKAAALARRDAVGEEIAGFKKTNPEWFTGKAGWKSKGESTASVVEAVKPKAKEVKAYDNLDTETVKERLHKIRGEVASHQAVIDHLEKQNKTMVDEFHRIDDAENAIRRKGALTDKDWNDINDLIKRRTSLDAQQGDLNEEIVARGNKIKLAEQNRMFLIRQPIQYSHDAPTPITKDEDSRTIIGDAQDAPGIRAEFAKEDFDLSVRTGVARKDTFGTEANATDDALLQATKKVHNALLKVSPVIDRASDGISNIIMYHGQVPYKKTYEGTYYESVGGFYKEFGTAGSEVHVGASKYSINPSNWLSTVGGHNAGSGLPSIYAHEFGHHFLRDLSPEDEQEWKDIYGLMGKRAVSKTISVYGATNYDEGFAESFAAYTHSDYGKNTRLPAIVEAFFSYLLGIRR